MASIWFAAFETQMSLASYLAVFPDLVWAVCPQVATQQQAGHAMLENFANRKNVGCSLVVYSRHVYFAAGFALIYLIWHDLAMPF